MTTIDANGIIRYEDTDGAPTPPVLNLGLQSVSDAISNIGAYRRAANATARAALVAQYSPTPAKPLLVYREDLPVERAFEFTRNGTTWFTVNSTGTSVQVGDVTAFSGASTALHLDGPFVTGSGFIRHTAASGGLSTVWKTIGGLPGGLNPIRDAEIFPIYSNLAQPVYCRILRDGGAVQIGLQAGSGTVALNNGHVFYLSGIRWRYV